MVDDVAIGDSIAVNGCCLTVVGWGEDDGGGGRPTSCDETFARTNLGDAGARASPVNLERPVRLDDRLGGHLVQGHVDGVGEIVDRRTRPAGPRARGRCCATSSRRVRSPSTGCRLTVVEPLDDGFTVAVIPHTAEVTTLGRKGPGDPVNLEVDVIAKYVERLLAPLRAEPSTLRRRRRARRRATTRSHQRRPSPGTPNGGLHEPQPT